jgi:hypothetical protein
MPQQPESTSVTRVVGRQAEGANGGAAADQRLLVAMAVQQNLAGFVSERSD